ncbi:YesL family protein [Cytobacillus sp. FSL H8-0458]|uniref:YesL family protein n=1 Tax=Cytobacillus sp. FSL H8-0458 TaxID=2975346 RepID=UPI0030F6D18F
MDGKLYRTMEFIMNAFLLNLLWLVFCLPVLTIFPATTAMFGVVREWQNHKDIRLASAFFRHFKENFKQSFLIGAIWLVFSCLLIADFLITNQLNSNFKYVLFSFLFLLSIVYVFASVTIFPVIVHYRGSLKDVIKNTLLLSVGNLHFTLLTLLVLAGAAGAVYYFPAATLFCFSITAYLSYTLVSKGFLKTGNVQAEDQTAFVQ